MDYLTSLAFYIHCAKIKGKNEKECFDAEDYHLFLADVEDEARVGSQFTTCFSATHPLVPLAGITLPQSDYEDAVQQIYANRPYTEVTVPVHLPPQPVVRPAGAQDYFANYITQVVGGDTTTQKAVKETIDRINQILQKKPVELQRVSGLVVGRVQSGKTRNYIGLMLKAFTEGWNVIIVLTSDNTALATQTRDRIAEEFESAGILQNVNCELNFRNRAPLIRPQGPILNGVAPFLYWGVAMKETNSLNRVHQWFSQDNTLCPQMRVFVIDDEADNATPDSRANNRLLDENEIDEDIETIRLEESQNPDDPDFEGLAAWFEMLKESTLPEIDDSVDEGLNIENSEDEADVEDCNTSDVLKEQSEQVRYDVNINTEDLVFREGEVQYDLFNVDKDASTAEVLQRLHDLLRSGNPTAITNCIFQNQGYRKLLRIDGFVREDKTGQDIPMPVADLIYAYFNRRRGKGRRTIGRFVRLLKSILDIAETRSTINNKICALIEKVDGAENYTYPFLMCAYIGYTATPYACILNQRPDQNPIYADFMRSLEKSPQYFGLQEIYGETGMCDPSNFSTRMGIVNEIPDDPEKKYLLNPLQGVKVDGCVPELAITDDLTFSCNKHKGKWDTMREALAWLFCTAAARRYIRTQSDIIPPHKRNDRANRWTTMLVNVDQKQEVHRKLKEWISKYLNEKWCDAETRDSFLEECHTVWLKLTEGFPRSRFDELFNKSIDQSKHYGEIKEYLNWEIIKPIVEEIIRKNTGVVHVGVINSTPEGRRFQASYSETSETIGQLALLNGEEDHIWIICGGNTISRGLTLDGLTVSYFDRIRKMVAVDTMTQMARWFGYRPNYELLPRIWMVPDSIREMKYTALVERNLHEKITDNFNNGYSPSDPEHFMIIYSWGRKLSGRARSMRVVASGVSTHISTSYISVDIDKARNVRDRIALLLNGIRDSESKQRTKNTHQYWDIPLWENIDGNLISSLFNDLKRYYPEASKTIFDSLIREMENSEDHQNWDIVIGEPRDGNRYQGRFTLGYKEMLRAGNPENVLITGTEAKYQSTRLHIPFYSMIPSEYINQVDWEYLETEVDTVASNIAAKTVKGKVFYSCDQVLPLPEKGVDIKARLNELLLNYATRRNEPVPAPIMTRFEGTLDCIRNRASAEHINKIHHRAEHTRPVLQFYLLTPPPQLGFDDNTLPLISIAVYWPNHDPDTLSAVSIGLPPPDSPVPQRQLWSRARDLAVIILKRDTQKPWDRRSLLVEILSEDSKLADAIYPDANADLQKLDNILSNEFCLKNHIVRVSSRPISYQYVPTSEGD
jgi:hypothetical protein